MDPSFSRLPSYLRKFAAEQNYEKYTAEDHAAWRYIMRQNRAFFSWHAVGIYLEGLRKTGIPLDRIPRISEMDECLSEFGWGAVPVRGFIPPAAFLEFQAMGILPIACDMRTVNHIAYTPAPDIVHEAAGHAPIIAEPTYAAYLRRYARMAQKAIQSLEDIRVYEAIRYLSDIKENPDTKPGEIALAEERLKTVSAAVTHTSEATWVARMAWWTVEYGLVGPLKSPRIYGAGLLSSVGESQHCLSDKVKKIPLTVDCVETSYNITEPQPQLFVTPDMDHLVTVLEELEKRLAFRIGGAEGLRRAKQAQTVNTVVLDSGLEVSGVVTDYVVEPGGEISFFKMVGPVQLAVGGRELPGHGRKRHPDGFSSPLGDFERFGFRLTGTVLGETPHIRTYRDCRIQRGDEIYFDPSWGEFDLALGGRVVSVYGGPADRAAYGELDIGEASTSPARTTPFSEYELSVHGLYRRLRELREKGSPRLEGELAELAKLASDEFSREWLAGVEILEMTHQKLKRTADYPWAVRLEESLRARAASGEEPTSELIQKGLALLSTPD